MKLKRKKCWRCGREPLDPITGFEAARHRANFVAALGSERGDMLAYAHCISRTLMTEAALAAVEGRGPRSHCKCDLQAWESACTRWQSLGSSVWEALGVGEPEMVKAEAWRLRTLRRERSLSADEKDKLRKLRASMTPDEWSEIKVEVAAGAEAAADARAQYEMRREGGLAVAAVDFDRRIAGETVAQSRQSEPMIVFKCPFCGQEVRAGGPNAVLLHELPTCEEFDKDEPHDVFLHKCRMRMSS